MAVFARHGLQGKSVLITDWRCDWVAPGIAELLVKQGFDVSIAINGLCLGETLPLYVRDELTATAALGHQIAAECAFVRLRQWHGVFAAQHQRRSAGIGRHRHHHRRWQLPWTNWVMQLKT